MTSATSVSAEIGTQQRALLARLLELTGEQRRALDAGDMAALNALSALRAQHVAAAASFIPPHSPWDAAVTRMVADLQQASESLHSDLGAALEQVKRDMQELHRREHVADYLPGAGVKGRLAWKG